MNVHEEIKQYAKETDKPALNWLLNKYHMESQWRFVARCTFRRYGIHSYQTHRVWAPTSEGQVLYEHGRVNESTD